MSILERECSGLPQKARHCRRASSQEIPDDLRRRRLRKNYLEFFSSYVVPHPSSFLIMKIVLAGAVGGIAMFIWTSIAHMFLPLGEAGLREIPNESAVLDAMQANIGYKSGL